jgi:hypothetical protein
MKLTELSNGRIKTGVYNAKKTDGDREELQRRWWAGDVQVVCAVRNFLHVNSSRTGHLHSGDKDYR